MQLKLKRSQREGGSFTKTIIFCLDARAEMTAQEQQSIVRYKLQSQVIYNSEASKRHLERGVAQNDGTVMGGLKGIASAAMAGMNLNITISSLQQGQHIECKTLDELLGAEEALMTACRNLKEYLQTASTFDGREVLIDFDAGEPTIVAQATTPAPMLIAPSVEPIPTPAPQAALAPPATPPNDDRSGYAEPVEPPPIASMAYASTAEAVYAPNEFERWMARQTPKSILKWIAIAGVCLLLARCFFSLH